MKSRIFALTALLAVSFVFCRTTSPPPPPPGPVVIPPNPAPATPPPAPAPTPQPVAAPAAAPDLRVAAAPPPPASPPPAAAVPDQPPAPAVPVAVAPAHTEVLRLKQAGLSDEFILNKIRSDNIRYDLTTQEILDLRAAGLSESLLEAMLRSGQPPSSHPGTPVARKAEFSGLARVSRGFLGLGTSTKNVGRLVVDGETVSWFESADPEENFSVYAKNIKEVFNTCVLRPNQNLCFEFGFVTYTGDVHRFRDPGWKNGENRLVSEATSYFRQAFPNFFFSQREVDEP